MKYVCDIYEVYVYDRCQVYVAYMDYVLCTKNGTYTRDIYQVYEMYELGRMYM